MRLHQPEELDADKAVRPFVRIFTSSAYVHADEESEGGEGKGEDGSSSGGTRDASSRGNEGSALPAPAPIWGRAANTHTRASARTGAQAHAVPVSVPPSRRAFVDRLCVVEEKLHGHLHSGVKTLGCSQ